jgi:hypothetical protein
MPTIGDTLNQIQKLQGEIKEAGVEGLFAQDLMNFTTVVFFQYLPHAVLDEEKQSFDPSAQMVEKYYELAAQPELLSEFVRFSNMGQFLCIWNSYEKYLRQKYLTDYGLNKFKIKKLFEDLIARAQPEGCDEIREEFDVMRNTRNSLHDGGVFNKDFNSWSGNFCGATYEFSPGDSVDSLRIADVSRVMWKHYQAFESTLP